MGMNVAITDESRNTAALALQGPNARKILNTISDKSLNSLKFFRLTHTKIMDIPVTISRTGYTGDLGYEIWTKPRHALDLWEILMEYVKSFGITPTLLHALDMAMIEAAFILLDVDYISAKHTTIDNRKSSPLELGLNWAIKIQSENFIGKNALIKEKHQGSTSKLRGIEIKWDPLEKEFKKLGLPPELPLTAWRNSAPIYRQKKQTRRTTKMEFDVNHLN